MYVLTFDIGSTNIKSIILEIKRHGNDEDVSIISKERINNTNFADFFYYLTEKYNIKSNDVEKIVVTGTGASYLGDTFQNIGIVKVDEFSAIGYGGIILSKLDEAIIVSIGTGTTIVYSNLYTNERIGGTGLGGGTFVGLSNAIINKSDYNCKPKTFEELIDMARNGSRENVDLCIGDISKVDILNMSKGITAANFAGMCKSKTENDFVAAVANLVLENISLIVRLLDKNLPVVYIGTMVTDEFIKNRLLEISSYTGSTVRFVDNADFAIAIGAWEYYLLKIRNDKYC